MTETFATLLGRARRNTRDPQRGGALTQERFAELIAQQLETSGTLGKTVSSWERGKGQPRRDDRATLRAIVSVLLRCEGLASLEEANILLRCGGYARLARRSSTPAPKCRRQVQITVRRYQYGRRQRLAQAAR